MNGSTVTKMHEGGPEIQDDPLPTVRHCTGSTPQTVAIVACGPTAQTWHAANWTYERQVPKPDEVWCLNKGLRTQRCDVGFVLDDLIGEARRSAEYAQDLADLGDLPIITSTVDHDVRETFPGLDLRPYPYGWVVKSVGWLAAKARGQDMELMAAQLSGAQGDAIQQQASHNLFRVGLGIGGHYMHNSIPMMLAYALAIGVKKVFLFGADYTFPGMAAREDDRANCEYWVGLCLGLGMDVHVSDDTTLLNRRQPRHVYGYGARPPVVDPITRREVDDLVRMHG